MKFKSSKNCVKSKQTKSYLQERLEFGTVDLYKSRHSSR